MINKIKQLKQNKKAQGAKVFIGLLVVVFVLLVFPGLFEFMSTGYAHILVSPDSSMFTKVFLILLPFIMVMILLISFWRSFQ